MSLNLRASLLYSYDKKKKKKKEREIEVVTGKRVVQSSAYICDVKEPRIHLSKNPSLLCLIQV